MARAAKRATAGSTSRATTSRRIDWNLTARTNATHVRDTIADRELETWLVVDGTASLDFGTASCEKRDLALAAAAAFGFLTCRVPATELPRSASTVRRPRCARPAAVASGARAAAPHRAAPACRRTHDGRGSLADALQRARPRRAAGAGSSWSSPTSSTGATGRASCARSRRATRSSSHRSATHAKRSSRRSGLLTLVDPETGRRQEVQTNSTQVARAIRRPPLPSSERRSRARCARAAPATSSCPLTATGSSTSCGSPMRGGADDDVPCTQPVVAAPRDRRAGDRVRDPPESPAPLRRALHEPRPARISGAAPSRLAAPCRRRRDRPRRSSR